MHVPDTPPVSTGTPTDVSRGRGPSAALGVELTAARSPRWRGRRASRVASAD
jgi:hypothetical protein